MGFRSLVVRREGSVEYLTLNRPEVRNAFDDGMIADLTSWAHGAAADRDLRVVVMSGAGTVFSAGADVEWMAKMIDFSHEDNLRDAARMAQMFLALNSLPSALIGRVHGSAIGGGAGLAAVCDIVAAAEDAMFGFTETKLGILPAVISPYVLAKIGSSGARELFLTGMRFGAIRAKEIGLVHAVVPTEDLGSTVQRYVAELLTAAPSGIAAAKGLIRQILGRSPSDAISITTAAIAAQRVSAEGQEGLRAFLQKRKPSWASD